ncbi:hypothetical protein HPP92_028165 [Vanilla planifolia]|uniref:Uncharacterized protein n=1 Tax=Vanilla planifolia TaxID=51239 RepID=A0A835U4P3_VANPL|nr:hypothetical protein HPP92_028165 [Vanilla planifolia]
MHGMQFEKKLDMYLHSDQVLMPRKQSAWSTWNFVETTQNGACITYWQNLLQKLEPKDKEFLITLSPPRIPKNKILKWTNGRVIPSVGALKASIELEKIQGKRKNWFCGSYQGFGFHEDKVKSGLAAADAILGMELKLLKATRHMATSLMESGVRLIVTKFLQHFISTGSLMKIARDLSLLLDLSFSETFLYPSLKVLPCYLKDFIAIKDLSQPNLACLRS